MTLTRHTPYGIYCTYSAGNSREADLVQQVLQAAIRSELQSATLSGARISALADLDGFYVIAAKHGWDGEDALPVKNEAYVNARRFLSLMPRNWSKPEISADPDGEVAVEWHGGTRRRLSISFGPDERLSYAWLNGSERGHGTDMFIDEIPSGIAAQVGRLVRR
ncbi:MAG: hypothetical protein Q7S40_10530 [Opitutaceae bacterium]|nr:hypothetical protein [Opitutaceae bacterium]